MSDFLGRLVARTLGVAPIAQPVGRSMFAPGIEQHGVQQSGFSETTSTSSSPAMVHAMLPTRPEHHGPSRVDSTGPDPQADFSVLGALSAARLDFDLAGTQSFRPTRTATHPMDGASPDTQTQYWKAEHLTNQPETPSDSLDSRDHKGADTQSARVLVPAVTIQREAFPVSSFAGNREAERPMSAGSAAPVVKISIGRVEVRAEFPAPAQRTSPTRSPSLSLSLDEYARQRREGKR